MEKYWIIESGNETKAVLDTGNRIEFSGGEREGFAILRGARLCNISRIKNILSCLVLSCFVLWNSQDKYRREEKRKKGKKEEPK